MTNARGATTPVESYRLAPAPPRLMPAVAVAAALGTETRAAKRAPPSARDPSPVVRAASRVTGDAAAALRRSVAFRQLPIAQQSAIERDLHTIRQGIGAASALGEQEYAAAMETPDDLRMRIAQSRMGMGGASNGTTTDSTAPPADGTTAGTTPGPKAKPATETLASRVGALSDEVDFPGFVAGLVHGTFDAMLDASIRQMEAFADLVSAVAKTVDEFTRDNVSRGQAIDTLADKYPNDLVRVSSPADGSPAKLQARQVSDDGEVPSPEWLADYDLAGEELTDDLIENQLIPAARKRVGEGRLQTLATMVLLGMNRVVVKDGTISAKVRFRAAARDTALVNYAVSQEPPQEQWATRGSSMYAAPSTMISTVNANVQTDTDLKAELFGEVRINFVSETLPLDRFVDAAKMSLLQGNARVPKAPAVTSGASASTSAPALPPALPPATTPPAAPPPATPPAAGGPR